MSFQENLIRARKARGMTQEELAARLSISRQAVSKWETGESLPDLYKLAALADELGVSTDELCGREPAALCGEVPATAFAGDAAEREAFAEEIRRIAKQNRSLRCVVGILVLICGVLTMLSGYRSLQNSKAPSNEITTPAPLPDTITISGLTLDIDGIALVFRFVPSVSGEGYEWSASCAPGCLALPCSPRASKTTVPQGTGRIRSSPLEPSLLSPKPMVPLPATRCGMKR